MAGPKTVRSRRLKCVARLVQMESLHEPSLQTDLWPKPDLKELYFRVNGTIWRPFSKNMGIILSGVPSFPVPLKTRSNYSASLLTLQIRGVNWELSSWRTPAPWKSSEMVLHYSPLNARGWCSDTTSAFKETYNSPQKIKGYHRGVMQSICDLSPRSISKGEKHYATFTWRGPMPLSDMKGPSLVVPSSELITLSGQEHLAVETSTFLLIPGATLHKQQGEAIDWWYRAA